MGVQQKYKMVSQSYVMLVVYVGMHWGMCNNLNWRSKLNMTREFMELFE